MGYQYTLRHVICLLIVLSIYTYTDKNNLFQKIVNEAIEYQKEEYKYTLKNNPEK
jgi:hypothetical protein